MTGFYMKHKNELKQANMRYIKNSIYILTLKKMMKFSEFIESNPGFHSSF